MLGKAVSSDAITFTKCNLQDPCNGTLDLSRVPNVKHFLRHHTLVADGLGNVVYLTLADTDGDMATAETVVAFLSTDGGTTFATAFPVPSEDNCGSGEMDLPHATFDYTTSPPTLWAVWRINSSGSSFGGCVRRFFIDGKDFSPARLVPLDSEQGVVGMDRDALVGGSQGGLQIQAGDGLVSIVYANSDEDDTCPTSEHHGVGWGSVSTFDNGFNWVDHARMFHSDTWQSCLTSSATPSDQNTVRSFDFVRTPTGIEYVAIADTPGSIRLFMNAAGGTKGSSGVDTVNPWFEWCPGTNTTIGDPLSPTRNWIRFEDGPCSTAWFSAGTFSVQLPTIASDGAGRVAVGFYTFDASAAPSIFLYTVAVDPNPLMPGSTFAFAPPIGVTALPTALTIAQKTVVQPFGAYLDMIPREPTGGGTLATPGCTDNGDFFPLFIQASATGSPQVATRGVHP